MMAPGLPEVAEKYNIASSTVTALTLSIFLVSFALAVRPYRWPYTYGSLIKWLRLLSRWLSPLYQKCMGGSG